MVTWTSGTLPEVHLQMKILHHVRTVRRSSGRDIHCPAEENLPTQARLWACVGAYVAYLICTLSFFFC